MSAFAYRLSALVFVSVFVAGEARAGEDAGPPAAPPVAPATVPASSAGGSASPQPAAEASLGLDDFRGAIWGRYRLRSTDDDDDQDGYLSVLVNGGDPSRHRFTFSVYGRFSSQLEDRDNPSPFYSIEDTFSSRLNGKLYRAYVDANRLDSIERVRIGRQDLFIIPEVSLFDGVLAETVPISDLGLRLRAFGGVPTHLYESSPSGDSIFGAGLEIAPSNGLWAALHFARIRDELVLSTERNEFIVLEARQRLGDALSVSGRATAREGNTRDVTARLAYADTDGWRGSLQYFSLLRTQRQFVTGLDPYYEVMKEERPYHNWSVFLEKQIDEMWSLGGGASLREMTDDSEEGAFNHEWRRVFLTPSLRGWPDEATYLSVTGELWEGERQAYRTAGFAVGRDFTETFRAEVGSEYALFKFSEILGEEREQVRTAYLRTGLDLREDLRAGFDYEVERDDEDTTHTLTLNLRWRF